MNGWVARVGVGMLLSALSACTFSTPNQPTPPSPTPTTRVFTVMTTERMTTTDPAAITTDADTIIGLNLFQRLMSVPPGAGTLRPDLASECLFTSEKTFECRLPKGLTFSSGHELTSSDVKFSILRALRLKVPGTSVGLFSSLDRIDTPDPQTVRFRLLWEDSMFGWALAGVGASIVDEEAYDGDQIRPITEAPIGSGPFQLEDLDDNGYSLQAWPRYRGPFGAQLPELKVQYADSPTAEKALTSGSAQLVWRTLDDAAVVRLQDQHATASPATSSFRQLAMTGTRVRRLIWNPSSPSRKSASVRSAVATALQPDRTLTSVVPVGTTGHIDAFAVGGAPKTPRPGARRVNLVLSYASSSPGLSDLARTIRSRLEDTGGLSVRVVPDAADADLTLTEQSAWVNNAIGWLQAYLANPLPGSAAKLEALEQRARTAGPEEGRMVALGEIQKQAAVDATVVPVAQGPTTLFLGSDADLADDSFGPAWQLGLWGARWKP